MDPVIVRIEDKENASDASNKSPVMSDNEFRTALAGGEPLKAKLTDVVDDDVMKHNSTTEPLNDTRSDDSTTYKSESTTTATFKSESTVPTTVTTDAGKKTDRHVDESVVSNLAISMEEMQLHPPRPPKATSTPKATPDYMYRSYPTQHFNKKATTESSPSRSYHMQQSLQSPNGAPAYYYPSPPVPMPYAPPAYTLQPNYEPYHPFDCVCELCSLYYPTAMAHQYLHQHHNQEHYEQVAGSPPYSMMTPPPSMYASPQKGSNMSSQDNNMSSQAPSAYLHTNRFNYYGFPVAPHGPPQLPETPRSPITTPTKIPPPKPPVQQQINREDYYTFQQDMPEYVESTVRNHARQVEEVWMEVSGRNGRHAARVLAKILNRHSPAMTDMVLELLQINRLEQMLVNGVQERMMHSSGRDRDVLGTAICYEMESCTRTGPAAARLGVPKDDIKRWKELALAERRLRDVEGKQYP